MAGSYNLGTAEGTIKINYDGKGAKDAVQDFDKIEGSGKKSTAALNDVGNKALVAGSLLAAGLGYAANKAIDFEKQISAIGAVSGATGAELEKMRAKALQLGADTSFSAGEAANAMEELAKAGISTTDILNGAADATVALAAAGGIELADAATIAANAMNQFGLSAKQLPKIVDQIAGAANNSAIDVKDLGLAMQQVGAVAHLAGLSFEDTAVAIAEMGNAGIKGSDAGTSLKTFLQNLIPTTKQQIALSKELGLITKDGSNAFFDQTGKVKSLAEVSGILKTALAGQTKEQQLSTLGILFGSDAIRAAAVLAENGADGFNKLAESMNKTKAADVAAARLNNVSGKMEALKGSVETAAIAFGTIMLPAINGLVKGLTSFANFLGGLTPAQQKFVIVAVAVAAALLIMVGVVFKIITAISAFKAAWIALNITFVASPIGLIITLIIALVAVLVILWFKSSAFRDFFIGIWEHIWSFLKTIGAWFAGPFAGFFVDLWNKIFPVIKAIGDFFAAVFNGIVAFVQGAWAIIKSVMAFFAPLFQAVFGLIISIVKLAWEIMGAIIAVAMALWRAIIEPVLNVIWAIIKAVVDRIVATWQFAWAILSAVIRTVWGFIGPYVMTAINNIRAGIEVSLAVIKAVWNTVWGTIKTVVGAAWDFIVGLVRGAVTNITNIINGVKAIVDKIRTFFGQLKEAASGGVGSLIAFVQGIPGKIIGALGNVGSMLYDAGRKIIQGLINGISGMIGAVKNAISGVLSQARALLPFSPAKEGPFSGRGWTLYSGQAIADAMAKGITDHAQNAIKATLKMVSQVEAVSNASSPLAQQFAFGAGSAGGLLAPSPTVSVKPQVVVVADFGAGMRKVVRSEIAENPDLVASTAATGDQTRDWKSPGRP